MLFNEPKLLKFRRGASSGRRANGFSALQRAEIAEILLLLLSQKPRHHVSVLFNEPKLLKSHRAPRARSSLLSFSALQRAEIAEIAAAVMAKIGWTFGFSALQRAEIAEMEGEGKGIVCYSPVSVLFNEPKLLKFHFAEVLFVE